MKKISKSNLILSTLALWAGVILVSGVANWLTIDTSKVANHVLNLHTLILWNEDEEAKIEAKNGLLNLNKGLVVWSGNSALSDAVVLWWKNNKVESNSDYSTIIWWNDNRIMEWERHIIVWWWQNYVYWKESTILWWTLNKAWSGWVVLWWKNNEASNNWVVIWWQSNKAGTNSLAMWSWAKAISGSFAWSAEASEWEARIDTNNGVLINTWNSISGVNLLVNGMIKVWWDAITGVNDQAWEIRYVNGCFYSYDGTGWHVMTINKSGCTDIATKESCQWGNVVLQHGDKATWYVAEFNTSCDPIALRCYNGRVSTSEDDTQTYSSYCHNFNSN